MYITAFYTYLPFLSHVIPREDTAKRLLSLAVLEVHVVPVIRAEHRQFPVGIDIPGVQSEPVAFTRVIINLLQNVHILISSAAVALRRIIGTDDVFVLVIDIFLLVPVSVFVVVRGRGIHHAGGGLPVLVAVGQAEKLVECAERTDTLHILQSEAFVVGRCCG